MIRYFRYLFSICENKEKYSLILFGLSAIIAALFETVNISALIPLINSIVNPADNIFDKHQYFSFLEKLHQRETLMVEKQFFYIHFTIYRHIYCCFIIMLF